MKNCTHYFIDDIINIKSFDPNKIKIEEMFYTNILIYYIRYLTVLSYAKIKSDYPLFLIFNKING